MVLEAAGVRVPLDDRQKQKVQRFFPPLVLQEAVHQFCNERLSRRATDAPTNPNQDTEEKFRTFVNKLAHICDYRPHGDTITALTVLQNNDKVLYVFVSNNRERKNLNKTKQEITGLLTILKDNYEPESRVTDQALYKKLLGQVLILTTVRVQGYLSDLSDKIAKCIKDFREEKSDADKKVIDSLDKLLKMIPKTQMGGQKSKRFISSTMECIQLIHNYRNSPLQTTIEKRAANAKRLGTENSSCWSALQHVFGRLLSYRYDVETLISAHYIWEDDNLFRDFEVDFLESSGLYPGAALRCTPEKPETIIGRIPNASPEQRESLKRSFNEFRTSDQTSNLDEALKEQWETVQSRSPRVHAEMLLHDWLTRTGGVQAHRFFGNYRYIGTSKPLCRLCQYYFDIIATPVRFRDGHPNTYLNWRQPDLYASSGDSEVVEEAKRVWREIMDQLKARVYADLRRLLVEKATDKKQNDSNTFTDRITLDGLFMDLRLE
ncbi:hypothetical protein OQA88_2031 [Cercophora sp. LCS_1]